MDFIEKLFKIFLDSSNAKDQYRKSTSLIILVLLLFFVYIFFGLLIDENAKISIIVLFVAYLLIKEAITQHDVLYSGNPNKNKYVRAFQDRLPSKYLIETYKLPKEDALNLWYKEFNKWKDTTNPMHESWLLTISRGFKCRMVYFIIISFRFITILSTLFILAIFLIQKFRIHFRIPTIDNYITSHYKLTSPILFTFACLLIYIIFLIINYPSIKNPRGCFLRFNEINNQNITWLKSNFIYKNENEKTDNNNS